METVIEEQAPAVSPAASLQARILARTSPTQQAARGQPYNYAPLWYGRPDGSIVQLAGDPQNRAYYEDKGFAVLRPVEVVEWEAVRPHVVAEQREKATIISTIRRLGSKHPGVEIVDNLDDLDIPDLKLFLVELGTVTGAPVKVLARRFGTEAERPIDEPGALPVRSGAELEDKLTRARARGGR